MTFLRIFRKTRSRRGSGAGYFTDFRGDRAEIPRLHGRESRIAVHPLEVREIQEDVHSVNLGMDLLLEGAEPAGEVRHDREDRSPGLQEAAHPDQGPYGVFEVLDKSQGKENVEGSLEIAVVREKIALKNFARNPRLVEKLSGHPASGRGVVYSGDPAAVGEVEIGEPRRLGATDLEHRTPGRPLKVPPEERVEPPVGIVARIVVTGTLLDRPVLFPERLARKVSRFLYGEAGSVGGIGVFHLRLLRRWRIYRTISRSILF